MKKRFAVAVIICVLMPFIALCASKKRLKKEGVLPDGFEYKSRTYSCKIDSFGVIRDIKCGKVMAIQKEQLHGAYKGGKGDPSRLFQTECDGEAIYVEQNGKPCYTITKRGLLKNKKYAKAAKFTETIKLTPNSLSFTMKVTMLVSLKTQQNTFTNILKLPIASYGDKKYKALYEGSEKNEPVNLTLPLTFSKDKPVNKQKLTKLMFSLENVFVTVKTGEKTSMALLDTRAWDGKDFRIDIGQKAPWNPKPTTFPEGTILNWEFTLDLKRK